MRFITDIEIRGLKSSELIIFIIFRFSLRELGCSDPAKATTSYPNSVSPTSISQDMQDDPMDEVNYHVRHSEGRAVMLCLNYHSSQTEDQIIPVQVPKAARILTRTRQS